MIKEKLYKMLKMYKFRMTPQQYKTIKGQINNNEFMGAYKGMLKLLESKGE